MNNRLSYCFAFVWAALTIGSAYASVDPDSTRYVINDPVVSTSMRHYSSHHQAKDDNDSQSSYPDNVSLDPCSFPVESSIWSIALDTMINDTICTLITPLVGDLDGDGIPEIVCFSNRLVSGGSAISGGGNPGTKVKNVVVYDGFTHQRKIKFDLPQYVSAFEATPYGLARCANGDAMIVFACTDNNLYAYRFTSTTFSLAWGPVSYGSGSDYATVVGFTDFNNDGNPEVYVRNKIFDLATGTLLLTVNSTNRGATYAHVGAPSASISGRMQLAASFACDIVGDSQSELLLGNEIYSIQITNSAGVNGNSAQLYATAPQTIVSGISSDGHSQVADFNLDGHLDVLFTCRPSVNNQGVVYVYVWDVFNNTVSTPIQQAVSQPGKSIPLIADIDNDGTPEVVLHCGVPGENVRAYKYSAATHSFSLFWTKGFSEDSYSNSLTLFDFNQDGENELLICDQNNISIVNGSTPVGQTLPASATIATFPFKEVTIMQYPVIADVDNDGAAEIVFVGNENAATIQGSLNILRSGSTPWAPARPVWNQYMYNITNVNMDLTIPAVQFNNAYAFVDNTGSTTVLRRPYNNFLQQATNIDTNGVPYREAADLVPGEVTLTETESGMLLNLEVCNIGGATFLTDTLRTCVYINTYQGPVSVHVNSFKVDGSSFFILSDDCYSTELMIPFDFFCPFMPFDSVCFAFNDVGDGVGEGDLPPECNYENNPITIYAPMAPLFEEYFDTICTGQSYNNHGFNIPSSRTQQSCEIVDSLTDPDDCRFLAVLHLRVIGSGTIDSIASACDSYEWYGDIYEESGDFYHEIESGAGCSQMVHLQLTINYSSSSEVQQSACDSYTWNGQSYNQSGTYTYRTETVAGCDSVVTLYLTIRHSDTTNRENLTVCDSLTWHNVTYSQSGTYYYRVATLEGCLEVEVLTLTVVHSAVVDTFASACDYYEWRGEMLVESGEYPYHIETTGDCDSVILLHLSVHPSYYTEDEVELCQGNAAMVHGTRVSEAGTLHFDFRSAHQCDSSFVTTVVVHSTYDRVDSVRMCTGNPEVGYHWVNGETYYHSTDAPVCRMTSIYGCDSILHLRLTIDRSLRAVIHCEPEFPTYDNNHVCLSNATSSYLTQHWYMYDGTVNEDTYCCFDMPFGEDSVTVRLVVSSGTGCFDTATLVIQMDRSTLYIPNVFTPSLATNSSFKVYGNSLLEAEAFIYTREGLLVAQFDALNEEWDGTHDGEKCPQGTYVYKVRYRSVLRSDEWHIVTGTVTLLR